MGGRCEVCARHDPWPCEPATVFEYDPAKSRANRAKHGIDFEKAEHLWEDRLGFDLSTGHPSEPRLMRLA